MICKIKNCYKEAKNIAKIFTVEFQLCDEHFPSFIELYNKEYIKKSVSEMFNYLKKSEKRSD